MKVCSKCKRQLPEVCFVKSPRYLDGLYPSCKECRKATLQKTLENHPLCFKCEVRPHLPNAGWCQECYHETKFKDRVPKFKRKPNTKDPNFCSRCGIRPPRDYGSWCQPCMTDYNKKWRQTKNGVASRFVPEPKRKRTARHYINLLHRRGKVSRGPCYLCGEPSEHFHHLSYEDRSRNVIDLCHFCHVLVHRALRKLLTASA